MPAVAPGDARLYRWERAGLALAALAVVAFGVMVEVRSAFQRTSKTDFGVYARAAWAVRSGQELYAVIDNNGWHYCYPPALAVALAPLADPYPWEPRDGYLPFWASVAIWFVFGVLCVLWAADRFAAGVLPDAARGTRRWWYARTMPLMVCAGPIGHTLGRGQVNTLVVALIAGAFVSTVRGRRMLSGGWLAAAAVVKVIPAYLALLPLVRRDARGLAGMAAGGAVLLAGVPAAVWGPAAVVDVNRKVVELVLAPGLTGHGNQDRAKELTNTSATDSQSFQSAVHFWQHPDPKTAPAAADKPTRLTHWGLSVTLTVLAVAVAWRRKPAAPADVLVLLGALTLLMALISPVSHMHYYAFGMPLVAGLWLKGLAARPGAAIADGRTLVVLWTWGLATGLPLFPGAAMELLRSGGCGTLASVGLVAFGLATLGRGGVAAAGAGDLPVASHARRTAAAA